MEACRHRRKEVGRNTQEAELDSVGMGWQGHLSERKYMFFHSLNSATRNIGFFLELDCESRGRDSMVHLNSVA